MGGTQPDSTEIKSGLLPRFPGRRACEVNLRLSCFVVWLVVVRTGVWTAQAIGHLHVWIMIRVRGNAGYSSLCKRFVIVSLGRVSTCDFNLHQNVRETAVTIKNFFASGGGLRRRLRRAYLPKYTSLSCTLWEPDPVCDSPDSTADWPRSRVSLSVLSVVQTTILITIYYLQNLVSLCYRGIFRRVKAGVARWPHCAPRC